LTIKKQKKTAEFQLNLLTLDAEALGIPDTEYPTFVKMSSSEFVRLCRELTQLAESVRIEVDDKNASFSFTGKAGAGKIKMKKNNAEKIEDQIDIKCDEKVNSNYGLQYLNSFAKASSLSSHVTLNLSSQFPLMIEYEIENMGFVKFYLAPKMDDEADKNPENTSLESTSQTTGPVELKIDIASPVNISGSSSSSSSSTSESSDSSSDSDSESD